MTRHDGGGQVYRFAGPGLGSVGMTQHDLFAAMAMCSPLRIDADGLDPTETCATADQKPGIRGTT